MFNKFKKELDQELKVFIRDIDRRYGLNRMSPLLFSSLKNYILRDGKRIRPILFLAGYKGFSDKSPKNILRSALALELLHDFLLVHDDIVDKSDTRRGQPSLHNLLESKIRKFRKINFSGTDLAIIAGDIMYAIAIESFLAITEDPKNKEKALRTFVESTCYTGCGEFIELLYSAEDISKTTLPGIFRIYDYKTAYYTFVAPLVTGALLAGAKNAEIAKLTEFGLHLGRAFQVHDDILGIFAEEAQTGKSSLSDLQENKKTLILWHAYRNSSAPQKKKLQEILNRKKITRKELLACREIITQSRSQEFARKQISLLFEKSLAAIRTSRIKTIYKQELLAYAGRVLGISPGNK